MSDSLLGIAPSSPVHGVAGTYLKGLGGGTAVAPPPPTAAAADDEGSIRADDLEDLLAGSLSNQPPQNNNNSNNNNNTNGNSLPNRLRGFRRVRPLDVSADQSLQQLPQPPSHFLTAHTNSKGIECLDTILNNVEFLEAAITEGGVRLLHHHGHSSSHQHPHNLSLVNNNKFALSTTTAELCRTHNSTPKPVRLAAATSSSLSPELMNGFLEPPLHLAPHEQLVEEEEDELLRDAHDDGGEQNCSRRLIVVGHDNTERPNVHDDDDEDDDAVTAAVAQRSSSSSSEGTGEVAAWMRHVTTSSTTACSGSTSINSEGSLPAFAAATTVFVPAAALPAGAPAATSRHRSLDVPPQNPTTCVNETARVQDDNIGTPDPLHHPPLQLEPAVDGEEEEEDEEEEDETVEYRLYSPPPAALLSLPVVDDPLDVEEEEEDDEDEGDHTPGEGEPQRPGLEAFRPLGFTSFGFNECEERPVQTKKTSHHRNLHANNKKGEGKALLQSDSKPSCSSSSSSAAGNGAKSRPTAATEAKHNVSGSTTSKAAAVRTAATKVTPLSSKRGGASTTMLAQQQSAATTSPFRDDDTPPWPASEREPDSRLPLRPKKKMNGRYPPMWTLRTGGGGGSGAGGGGSGGGVCGAGGGCGTGDGVTSSPSTTSGGTPHHGDFAVDVLLQCLKSIRLAAQESYLATLEETTQLRNSVESLNKRIEEANKLHDETVMKLVAANSKASSNAQMLQRERVVASKEQERQRARLAELETQLDGITSLFQSGRALSNHHQPQQHQQQFLTPTAGSTGLPFLIKVPYSPPPASTTLLGDEEMGIGGLLPPSSRRRHSDPFSSSLERDGSLAEENDLTHLPQPQQLSLDGPTPSHNNNNTVPLSDTEQKEEDHDAPPPCQERKEEEEEEEDSLEDDELWGGVPTPLADVAAPINVLSPPSTTTGQRSSASFSSSPPPPPPHRVGTPFVANWASPSHSPRWGDGAAAASSMLLHFPPVPSGALDQANEVLRLRKQLRLFVSMFQHCPSAVEEHQRYLTGVQFPRWTECAERLMEDAQQEKQALWSRLTDDARR